MQYDDNALQTVTLGTQGFIVNIKTLSGGAPRIVLESGDECMHSLARELERKHGYPQGSYRLYYSPSKSLDVRAETIMIDPDGGKCTPLRDYGLVSGETMWMIQKLRGD